MSKKSVLLIIFLVAILGISFFFYWSKQPSFTVAKAGYSILYKKRDTFNNTIELQKIADGLADDTVSVALKKMGADPLGNPGIVQSSLALQMVESLKPQLVNYVFKTVDSYFVGEPIVNSSGQSLNSVVLMLLASHSDFKFDWKLATEQNPDFAIVSASFLDTRNKKPVILRLRLEKQEFGWKIVRVYNLVESLSED